MSPCGVVTPARNPPSRALVPSSPDSERSTLPNSHPHPLPGKHPVDTSTPTLGTNAQSLVVGQRPLQGWRTESTDRSSREGAMTAPVAVCSAQLTPPDAAWEHPFRTSTPTPGLKQALAESLAVGQRPCTRMVNGVNGQELREGVRYAARVLCKGEIVGTSCATSVKSDGEGVGKLAMENGLAGGCDRDDVGGRWSSE